MLENNRRFHTSCVFYCLVFYNPMILIIPLAHSGDDPYRQTNMCIFLWVTLVTLRTSVRILGRTCRDGSWAKNPGLPPMAERPQSKFWPGPIIAAIALPPFSI